MNSLVMRNTETDRLEFYFGTPDSPGAVLNSISREDALSLMRAIGEQYGVRFGDPKCPCKDKHPQKFDRYANRWILVNA